jgi:putative PIG3 family NAD(P)H quinone oxidoreductase
MRALRISKPGGPEVLEVADVPAPEPKRDELLVRVRAAGVNRADTMQRRGHYPPPPGFPEDIPGLEYAGEVAATGSDVRHHRVGQRVFGLTGGGAQAEYLVVPETLALPTPEGLSDVEAGAIPEAYITAHDALFTQGSLAPGETVLIHAIGSGVGLAALQIARAIGCRVLGTSRSPAKLADAVALGLDVPIDVSTELFDDAVMRATHGRGVDVIIDFIGADYFERNLNSLATKGRLIFVSTLSGTEVALSIRILMAKRLRLAGTMLRHRSLDEKVAATRAFAHQVLPLLANGAIKVPIDHVYPVADAAVAHRRMEANENFGKLVLEI